MDLELNHAQQQEWQGSVLIHASIINFAYTAFY